MLMVGVVEFCDFGLYDFVLYIMYWGLVGCIVVIYYEFVFNKLIVRMWFYDCR